MEEFGVGAHEAQRGRRRGCVRTGGLVKPRRLMTDQEVVARTVEEEVWFWDKSLVKARVEWEVGGGPSWIHLVQLQTEVEGAQVEWGAEEAVSLVLEVACYPSPPQCGKLACALVANGHTLRWSPAPRGRYAPPQPTAGGAGGFQREQRGAQSFLDPESHPAAVTPVLHRLRGPSASAL